MAVLTLLLGAAALARAQGQTSPQSEDTLLARACAHAGRVGREHGRHRDPAVVPPSGWQTGEPTSRSSRAVAAQDRRAVEVARGRIVRHAVAATVARVAGFRVDAIRDPGFAEQCDPGDLDGDGQADDAAGCDFDCSAVQCGDGHTNPAASESCSAGDVDGDGEANDTSFCDRDCTPPRCGDGIHNVAAGEFCDGEEGCGDEGFTCDARCQQCI